MITKVDEQGGEKGSPAPRKTRAERATELFMLLETAAGQRALELQFRNCTGVREVNCPPASLLMVQTVLNREYPNG